MSGRSRGLRSLLPFTIAAAGFVPLAIACSSSNDTESTLATTDDDDDDTTNGDDERGDDAPFVPALDGSIDRLTTPDGASVCVADGGCNFSATPTPGSIQCGEAVCSGGKVCCGGLCFEPTAACDASKEAKECDEPSDCSPGEPCCASSPSEGHLDTVCGGCADPKEQSVSFAVCRSDSDCAAVFGPSGHCVVIDGEHPRTYGRCAN